MSMRFSSFRLNEINIFPQIKFQEWLVQREFTITTSLGGKSAAKNLIRKKTCERTRFLASPRQSKRNIITAICANNWKLCSDRKHNRNSLILSFSGKVPRNKKIQKLDVCVWFRNRLKNIRARQTRKHSEIMLNVFVYNQCWMFRQRDFPNQQKSWKT